MEFKELEREYGFRIDEIIGKVFSSVEQVKDNMIRFTVDENEYYQLEHIQDCCEDVYIESIVGDLIDLVGNPILVAEESKSESFVEGEDNEDFEWPIGEMEGDSATWTFFKFATIKGHVDIRFFGSSNGYYCEEGELVKYIKKEKD